MEIPRHWRLQKQRYSMRGEVCMRCGAPSFPARPVCPNCGGTINPVELVSNELYTVDLYMQSTEKVGAAGK